MAVLLPGLGGGWGLAGFSPSRWCRSSRCSFRTPTRRDGQGIGNSNSPVTDRYIACITVSRRELLGQVTGMLSPIQDRESAGDDKSRKSLRSPKAVSVRNGALTAGVLAL